MYASKFGYIMKMVYWDPQLDMLVGLCARQPCTDVRWKSHSLHLAAIQSTRQSHELHMQNPEGSLLDDGDGDRDGDGEDDDDSDKITVIKITLIVEEEEEKEDDDDVNDRLIM